MLIRAFRRVRASRAVRLVILGEGPDRNRIEETIRDQDLTQDVALPGFEPNPYKFMSHSSVFALSSGWEGFGVVLVEALALGLPVVSTDCTYGPAEILSGGRYGTLVPVGDDEALAKGILSALDSPHDTCDASHIHQFEISAVASRYLSVISNHAY